MSTVSPNLSLPYIQQNQAQKHVTHNEGMRLLDGVVQLSVLSRAQTAPPAQAPLRGIAIFCPAAQPAHGPGLTARWPIGKKMRGGLCHRRTVGSHGIKTR
jgi:hypothetical protein